MDAQTAIADLERRAYAARIPIYELCQRAKASPATFTRWRAGSRPSAKLLGKMEAAMAQIEAEKAV